MNLHLASIPSVCASQPASSNGFTLRVSVDGPKCADVWNYGDAQVEPHMI